VITNPRKAHFILSLALWVLGSSCSARRASEEQPVDSRRFLEVYRGALGRLQTACGSGYLEGVYKSQWSDAKPGRPEREATLEMAYGAGGNREKHVLIRRDLSTTPYFERVFLERTGRTLILERLDPARPFYIRWITKPSEVPDGLAPTDRRNMVVRAAYSIGGILIPTILDSPSFQITKLGRVDRDADLPDRVVFKSRIENTKSSPEIEGWLLLDPKRDWAVREYEVRIGSPANPDSLVVMSGTARYSDEAGQSPLPEEVTSVTRSGGGAGTGQHRIHFEARRRTNEPPAAVDFTLAAYGLGDYPWDGDGEAQSVGRGQARLIVDKPLVYFDRPAPNASADVSFQLTNAGAKPARVVGMRIGCASNLPTNDLPCQIEAGGIKRLALKLLATSEPGETRSTLYLYTTAPGQAEVELTLVGRKAAAD
jgi:hypothetical protein